MIWILRSIYIVIAVLKYPLDIYDFITRLVHQEISEEKYLHRKTKKNVAYHSIGITVLWTYFNVILNFINAYNGLPAELRSTVSFLKFKSSLKTYYFKLAFPEWM